MKVFLTFAVAKNPRGFFVVIPTPTAFLSIITWITFHALIDVTCILVLSNGLHLLYMILKVYHIVYVYATMVLKVELVPPKCVNIFISTTAAKSHWIWPIEIWPIEASSILIPDRIFKFEIIWLEKGVPFLTIRLITLGYGLTMPKCNT